MNLQIKMFNSPNFGKLTVYFHLPLGIFFPPTKLKYFLKNICYGLFIKPTNFSYKDVLTMIPV